MIEPLPRPLSPDVAPQRRRRALRAALVLLGILAVLVLAGALWLRRELHASLPQLDGEVAVAGLGSPVSVARDGLGVPTITGASRADVARGLGFVHAQDRFFQMDLLRRKGAGELAELFGSAALELDRELRVHRFRRRSRTVLERLEPAQRALLDAYAAGVNAGLAGLGAPPFEYLLLREAPRPWLPEDSLLAVYAMFFELHDAAGDREAAMGELRDALPPALTEFLTPVGTEHDAPLLGDALPTPLPPAASVVDLRTSAPTAVPVVATRAASAAARRRSPFALPRDAEERSLVGSNNFALAGEHTATGAALVANDMHLSLDVPNTWYRAVLRWREGAEERSVAGVTLPGTTGVVVGSNGHVAWAFTNSQGDWNDLVVLEQPAGDDARYATPAGLRELGHARETLRVAGGEAEELVVEETIWGPVVRRDSRGRRLVARWTAHDPAAVDLDIVGLEAARTIEEAMAVAHRSGIPPQNFTVGERGGRIGWTLIGRLPRRVGFDGRFPSSWADGERRWDGWLSAGEVPRVVDPPGGRIWTANQPTVSGDELRRVGDGGYAHGARAAQIRDGLQALEGATAADLLAVQLDDRALFLERWRELLLRVLEAASTAADPGRAEMLRLVRESWSGRAATDSVGYRLVRAFRLEVEERVFTALTAGVAPSLAVDEAGGEVPLWRQLSQREGPLWAVVAAGAPHLVPPPATSWDEALLAAADAVHAELSETCGTLAECSWGRRNTARVRHPLSYGIPLLGRWLDMPATPLAGDDFMPRVQAPGFGASERFVVSPGGEAAGIFHMPGGQSGHPLSPHYRDGHAAWEAGRPSSFLPGEPVGVLRLVPAG